MSELLKGVPAALALVEETAKKVESLKAADISPCLAMLRVGEDEGSLSYERGAIKRCRETGIAVRSLTLPADTVQDELMDVIRSLNDDAGVHGILMFRPLPEHLDEKAACSAITPAKDVDGISAASMAGIYSDSGVGFTPCVAEAVMKLLEYYNIETCGKRAVVIGRSLAVGRPVAMLLMHTDATVTVCHTKTRNLPEISRAADIVVLAAGKGECFGKEFFREGQTVVDIGITWSESKQKLVGDADFDSAAPVVSAISPVPGGVGSMTSAVLAYHTATAAEKVRQKTAK